jgi:hypothetical protein
VALRTTAAASAGVATVSGVGVAQALAAFSSVGAAATSWISAAGSSSIAQSSGVATVTGWTGSAVTAVASSAGVATVAGVGRFFFGFVGEGEGTVFVVQDTNYMLVPPDENTMYVTRDNVMA